MRHANAILACAMEWIGPRRAAITPCVRACRGACAPQGRAPRVGEGEEEGSVLGWWGCRRARARARVGLRLD